MRKLVFLLLFVLSACMNNDSLKQVEFNSSKKIKVNIEGNIKKPGLYLVNMNDDLNTVISMCGGYLKDSEILDNFKITKEIDIFVNSNKIKNKISLNNASSEDLLKIKGIGKSVALRIIEYRQKYNMFKSVADLKKIKGIKDKLFNKIYHYFKV